MIYWLPKLHKRPYKARFIANSSSGTTAELSKLLTSCLTAIKTNIIKYCENVYERSEKNMFWSIKNPGEVLSKMKDSGFQGQVCPLMIFQPCTTLSHKKFAVVVKERQYRLPTMYWLPKLQKRPYKSNRKAMNRNWSNQKANPALKTKTGNK